MSVLLFLHNKSLERENSMDEEVGKYKKKKKSNTSKAKIKSKHKHEYKSCLIRYTYDAYGRKFSSIQIASYCNLCGKIGRNTNPERKITEKTENGYCRMLNSEEILKQNEDLPVFDVNGWDDKYVPMKNIKVRSE